MSAYYNFWTRAHALVHRLSELWALFGGLVLMAVVMVNAYSISADMLFTKPFPGDFELTELGVAIAAFCFLPYCQMTGANVSADLFTATASKSKIMLMGVFASLVAFGFSLLLMWRMWEGLLGYREYEEITGILSIPIWMAFVPCLFSLVLLVAAAFVSLLDIFGSRKRA
ncbi:TRAP transporter small permease [Sneathiella aquimaris]|uniref:TRAP transporter small permease n=1 Tax=Sneathiella aquimaris TaxID=2599305 RepID=UPI00146CFFF2|nr:TRAP transporter small permease subunit [Sneathiella aquimaris]